MACTYWMVSKAVVAYLLVASDAFITSRIGISKIPRLHNKACNGLTSSVFYPFLRSAVLAEEIDDALDHRDVLNPKTKEIFSLVDQGRAEEAVEMLKQSANAECEALLEDKCFHKVLKALSEKQTNNTRILADELLDGVVEAGCRPDAEMYNIVIGIWSRSYQENGAEKCLGYLDDAWRHHEETGNEKYVPWRSSYISSIVALSRGRLRGQESAEKAELLLEEMERKRLEFPKLSPNTLTVNSVLNVWSKSRVRQGSARRSEQILERMISLGAERKELRPDTTSFNTVIDTLAKSIESQRETRAEVLLERMEELSLENPTWNCYPDQVSFNAVINCWAQSRKKGSARRATAILRHMVKRYEAGSSTIAPDAATYTTVINAWSRSRDYDAVERAEEVLASCEESYKKGNILAKPNTLTYNSMINCYSKSKASDADQKAMAMLDEMKKMRQNQEHQNCHPDVVTYTSVIDTLAKKRGDASCAEKAESLLNELVASHDENPDDIRLIPNVRTYTSTINAIGRSGLNPAKAERILMEIEKLSLQGNKGVTPDVVCYNALINAYGWSNQKGKAEKCFSLLQHMIDLSEAGTKLARPDIITANSILNACNFEEAESEEERERIVSIIVETLEIFQKEMPRYGFPDSGTYTQVLFALSKQMPFDERRFDMVEATFWQCCKAGHVNARVISALEQALPWNRFASIMGSALKSIEGEKTVFDLNLFPRSWTRHSISKSNQGVRSRASRKRDRGFKVTTRTLMQSSRQTAQEARSNSKS